MKRQMQKQMQEQMQKPNVLFKSVRVVKLI